VRRHLAILAAVAFYALPCLARGAIDPAAYDKVTQSDLIRDREDYNGKKVQVTGDFLFSGSDFCYQIRKAEINTKDYFCFAMGRPSLIRLYLKKDHPQVDQLLNLKKGQKITAFGVFDSLGGDYCFIVVDEIKVEPTN
jgi:hypothetical protein